MKLVIVKSSLKRVARCGTYGGYQAHKRRKEDTCERCREARRIYIRSNSERVKIYQEKYHIEHPSMRNEINRKWRGKNPAKVKEYNTRRYAKNPKKWIKYRKEYSLANPEKTAEWGIASSNRRRARKANVISEPYTAQQILELYGTNCHLCHEPIDLIAPRHQGQKGWEFGLHLEHVIPLALGGSNLIENVRPSHGLCNIRKGARQCA